MQRFIQQNPRQLNWFFFQQLDQVQTVWKIPHYWPLPVCGEDSLITGGFPAQWIIIAGNVLTHWGRVTHICVGKLTNIDSDNGLSPGRRQAIIWTNAGILLIRTLACLGTNFSEILGEIHSFSFWKMHLKMASAKWRLFGLGINELMWWCFGNTNVSDFDNQSWLYSTLIITVASL